MVQAGTALPHGGGYRRAYRACGNTHKVGQARCAGHFIGRDIAQSDRHQRDEKARHGDALDDGGNHDGFQVHLGAEVRTHPHHHTKHQERRRGVAPRIYLVDGFTHDGREHHGEQTHRRHHHARICCGIAHVLLQPQGQQHHVAKEQAVAHRNGKCARPKIAVFKQP